MTDLKISELPTLASTDIASGDWLPVVDSSTNTTKKVSAHGRLNTPFSTVAAFFSAVDAGYTAPDGTVVSAGPVQFMALSGANATGLRAGWVPFGYTTPNHFADNTTPGTTNMTSAIQAAIDYAAEISGQPAGADRTAEARVDFRAENYYLAGPIAWDSTIERVHLVANGAIITTDYDGPLISIGDTIFFTPGADTRFKNGTSGDLTDTTYTNSITGFVFRYTGTTATAATCIQMGNAWNTRIADNNFWNFTQFIDCVACGQAWIERNKFFVRAPFTSDVQSIVRTRGAYDSVNDYKPGSGLRYFGNEVSGNPNDRGQLLRILWVQSMDGLYYAGNHAQHYEKGLVANPTGSANNYQNNVLIDIISYGGNFWDDPHTGGRNISLEGSVGYTGTGGQRDGNFKNFRLSDSDFFRGDGRGDNGFVLSIADSGGFEAARGGIAGIEVRGNFSQHRSVSVNINGAEVGNIPAISPLITATFSEGRLNEESSGGIAYILADARGASITGCIFGEEENAPTYAAVVRTSDYTNSSIVFANNDISKTLATVEPYEVVKDASDVWTIGPNNTPDGRIDENTDGFATVSAFAAAVTGGYVAPDGTVRTAGPVQFMALAGSTATGLPAGWVPFGDVTPNHFADNTTPGTTNMRTALVNAWAYADDVHLLSESYLISGATVTVGDGKRLIGAGWTSGYGGGTTKGSIIVEDKTTAGNVFQILGATSAFSDRARTMFKDVGFVSASSKILTDLTGTVVNLISLKNTFLNVFENCLFTDLNVHAVVAGDATGSQNGVIFKGGQVTAIGDARAGFAGITGRYTYGHGIDLSLIPDSEINGTFIELCGRYGVRLGGNCRAIGVFNDLCWRGYELNSIRAQVIGGGCKWHQQSGFYAATDAKDWTVSAVNVTGNNYSNRVGPNENFAFRLTTGNTGWLISDIFAVDALSAGHPSKTDLQNFVHLGALGNTGTIDGARIGNPASGGTNIYDPFSNLPAGNIAIDLNPGTGTTPILVASLPTAASAGRGSRYFVSDATATTFASIVAGGGANAVPVYSDGTNWRIG